MGREREDHLQLLGEPHDFEEDVVALAQLLGPGAHLEEGAAKPVP
jgi:hypothetical protein